MTDVKYPHISLNMSQVDGNAYAIMGAVRRLLKRHGVSQDTVDEFTKEAKNGDYDHMIQTCMRWINLEL